MGETFSKVLDRIRRVKQTNKVTPAPLSQDILSSGDNGEIANLKTTQEDDLVVETEIGEEKAKEKGEDNVAPYLPDNLPDINTEEAISTADQIRQVKEADESDPTPLPQDILSNGDNEGVTNLNLSTTHDAWTVGIGDHTNITEGKCDGDSFTPHLPDNLVFCPLDEDTLAAPVTIPKRLLGRPRTPVLTYEERMLLADLNRFQQLDKRREFAVRQNQSLPRNGKLPKIQGEIEVSPDADSDD